MGNEIKKNIESNKEILSVSFTKIEFFNRKNLKIIQPNKRIFKRAYNGYEMVRQFHKTISRLV